MKTLITFLAVALYIVFLSFQPALAGAPPIQWQKTFGGISHDCGDSVQQTSDGGYIIAGDTCSFSERGREIYLIKTDTNGDSEWQKTFGWTADDYGGSVQQTSDGGYIIVGSTTPFGGGRDVYMIKTDSIGNKLWQKTFGGSDYDYGSSVQQTSDGGYIITGSTESYGAGLSDVYLIKTSPNGNLNWQKTFGGSGDDAGYSVRQTSDGGYIIVGYTNSYGVGGYDVYLVKTDSAGNSQWQKTFGGSDSDAGGSIQQTSDGGYVIAAITYSYGAGYNDVYLIKADSDGYMKWQKTFGGSAYDYSRSVQQTSDGGYIIAGYTDSYGAGSEDVYLIKTDPNGIMYWQKAFGGLYRDRGYSVQQTSDGGYIVAGWTDSYGAGDYDFYLIKLCPDGTLSADFNCNGTVYYEDLEVLVDQWLQPPGILSADIAPEPGDGIVNFLDFRILAQDWLQTSIP